MNKEATPAVDMILRLLMPITRKYDELTERNEHFDDKNKDLIQEILDWAHDTNVYINGVYTQFEITQGQWDKVEAELYPVAERTFDAKSDSVDGSAGERQDNVGEEGNGEESGAVLPGEQGRPTRDDASRKMVEDERKADSIGQRLDNDKGFEGRPTRNSGRHESESEPPEQDTGSGGSPVPAR